MTFAESLKDFASKLTGMSKTIATEEGTKMSMIVPIFQILGYDIFNPSEFCPEYTADVGIKKGEKVDYAILINGVAEILVECKWCGEQLDKHSSQLFRYFGTSPAKFGILTNGLVYRFFTDLDEANKMDLTPFLEINMAELKDTQINELKKFCKENFDKNNIFSTASELKYSNAIKEWLKSETENVSDEFARTALSFIYDGPKTQKVIDKFKPIVKKSFNGFINDIVNQKISSALTPDTIAEPVENGPETQTEAKVITTEDELQAFYIIRSILAEFTPINDIAYRDTESYFGVLYKDNSRKPICRLNLDTKKKQLLIPDENKVFTRHYLESITDIYNYKTEIINSLNRYNKKTEEPLKEH